MKLITNVLSLMPFIYLPRNSMENLMFVDPCNIV